MTGDRERLAEEIFQEAVDLPPGRRAAHLTHRCGGDPELQQEVEDLLRHHDDAAGFLEEPALTPAAPAVDDPPPDAIGPYRILQPLGEGGMGAVYLAQQEEPLRRQVALKIIKPGMDSREVVSRFEAERQALALMDHPGIARVYEAGTTERGRPYFVMEYVPGVPITDYCDRERLDVRSRIRLLIRVCEAIQHAHQRGVIHRDLKPSNVLVTVEPDGVRPKVIDFGVAKATAPELSGFSFVTSHGQVLGTPEFMSPEQARLTGADVDTRTDVYSLGMLLYLLLTGTLPFSSEELRRLGLEAMLRRIREDESTRPSDRLATAGHDVAEAARARRVAPDRLPRILRGDLDWIVMMALEKDRERRYASVSGLAADLTRYLDDEPVSAGPPSASYRLGKLARRHRTVVAFAGIVVLMLVAFAGSMAVQAGRIARERDRANEEATVAREVSDFLFELFEVSDPGHARGETITAREILDEGAARIEGRFADQPALQGRFQRAIGRVYRTLGLYEDSEPLLVQAVERLQASHGPRHPETLDAKHELAGLYWNEGRFEEAEAIFRECLEARTSALGTGDPETLLTMGDLGLVLWSEARYEEAEVLLSNALEGLTRALGPEDQEVLDVMNDLGLVYQSQGRYADAEPLAVEAFETRTRLEGPDHPHWLQGHREEAEALWRETLEIRIRVQGEDHQETLRTLGNLTRAVRDPEERDRLQLRVVEGSKRSLGEDHPLTLTARFNQAAYHYREGRLAEAEPIFTEVLEARRRVLGAEHPATISSMHAVGMLYRNMERYDEAESYLSEAHSVRLRVQGADHPDVFRSMNGLAKLYWLTGRDDEAESLYRATYEGRARVLGAEHPDTEYSRGELADFLESVGRSGEADALR
jgi:non-specific serine/threonine protein kinase/serine/threonine-protein kinase